jgi:hypothetical protein
MGGGRMSIENISAKFLKSFSRDWHGALLANIFSSYTDPTLYNQLGVCDLQVVKDPKRKLDERLVLLSLRKKPDSDYFDSARSESSDDEREADPSKASIRSFYLGFFEGGKPTLKLDDSADFFFNAPMTGCRLVIDENRILTHYDGGKFSDEELDKFCNFPADGKEFKKIRYIDSTQDGLVMVIRRRVEKKSFFKKKSEWQFYEQRYTNAELLNSKEFHVRRV